MSAPAPGNRIGPYDLIARLGAGGMGEVWKARDPRLDRTVAVKFSAADFTERFEREARAIAALNHPNIAHIYDVGDNYIVMEYVDGEPVRAPDSVRKLLDIAAQIAEGLAAAHAAGFAHRDLKPDNILVTREGRVKILDFGLARQTVAPPQDKTQTIVAATTPGMILGTVAYMSPEQARGQEVDARSDQFSFGLVLYELATGKRPFQRPSSAETMAAIIREEPEPLPSSVPVPLRWTIQRLLAKEPDERYESTKDLAAELRAMPSRLSEVSTLNTASLAPPASRRRSGWPLAVVAALPAIALALIVWRLATAPPRVDQSRFRFTPFAATSANETYPSWSPDGKSIAYVSQSEGFARLVVKRVDRNDPGVAIAEARAIFRPTWSPDGERLYYSEYGRNGSRVVSLGRGGGTPAVLFETPAPASAGIRYSTPALSPDGSVLAMLADRLDKGSESRHVVLSAPPGASPQPVGDAVPCCLNPTELVWASDSSRVAVFSPQSQASPVIVIEKSGKTRRAIALPQTQVDPSFAWLPRSPYLVSSSLSDYGDDQGLRLIDTRTGSVSPLLASSSLSLSPAVSPDGTKIAYSVRPRRYELTEIPLAGGGPHTLLPSNLEQHSMAFSPARDEFVFVRLHQLVVHDRERNDERVLVSSDDFPNAVVAPWFSWPEFSPDGNRVAFTCSGCERDLSIWVVSREGGSPAKVAGAESGGFGSSWSADGKWIAYTLVGTTMRWAKVQVGGTAKPEIDTSGAFVSWSPAGDLIAFRSPEGLTVVAPDGSGRRVLRPGFGRMVWTPDGKSILATRNEGHRVVLERVDVGTGAATDVLDLPPGFAPSGGPGGEHLSISRDGKTIGTSVAAGDGDIWIIDGFRPPDNLWRRLWAPHAPAD